MVEWTSKMVQEHQTEASKILLGLSMGFFFYDCILAFPFDVSILTGKRQRRWPQIAYFLTKLFMIGYFVITLVINYTQHQIDCQLAFYMLEMLMGFTVVSSSVLLACRTICVYEGPTRVLVSATLGVLALGLLAAWMEGVKAITGSWVPNTGFAFSTGACIFTEVTKDYWVKYVCTIIFDAVVLFLTAFGIVQLSGSSRIGVVLVRQGIVYFLLTFIVNILITVFTLLQLSPTTSLLLSVPQTTLGVICACRLYINLANEARSSSSSTPHSRNTSSMTPGNVSKNIHGSSRGGSGSSRNHSDGGKTSSTGKKSGMARMAQYVFRSDGGVQDTTVPSYFSSSSNPAERNHPQRGEMVQHQPQNPVNANTPYGQATIVQLPHLSPSNSGESSSQQTHRYYQPDLEKQQPPVPAATAGVPAIPPVLTTNPSFATSHNGESEYFYDTRSTSDEVAAAAARRREQYEDDDLAESIHAPPAGTHLQSVPPRRSSSHGGGGVQVETARFVLLDNNHPAPAYTQTPRHQRPSTAPSQRTQQANDVHHQDDEIIRSRFDHRLVSRKDVPRP